MNTQRFYRDRHSLQEDIVFLPAQNASLHEESVFLS